MKRGHLMLTFLLSTQNIVFVASSSFLFLQFLRYKRRRKNDSKGEVGKKEEKKRMNNGGREKRVHMSIV